MTRCATMAMVCRPDEQKRLTVAPETVIGKSAIRAIWRAMLAPVAPSGFAHPMRTSSTSPGSMPARCTACLTAWPPSVAPCVMLKAHFQLLARGAGTTLVECLAFGGEPGEQRRGFPELRVVVGVLLEALHRLHDVEKPH